MALPDDITIIRVDAAVLTGARPRTVGCNARIGEHGRTGRDPVVRLHTDAGITGWGWSGATAEDAHWLVGKKLREVFDPAAGTVDDFLAFDFPLWDLAGRLLRKPVYAMLGDAGCDPVPVYDSSIYFDDLEPAAGRDYGLAPLLNAVTAGLEAGFRAFKVKVGRGFRWMETRAGFERDIEVLHAVRELIGTDVWLLIDANNGYSPDAARELMHEAGACDIYWFEEPFPEAADECLAFKGFIRDGGWQTLIADGEGAEQRDGEFTKVLEAGGVDIVQFDLRHYTLTRWLRYLPVVAEAAALAAPHNWASHLAGFYIAQFARGCPHFAMGEIDTMTVPAVAASGYRLVDGKMAVPDTPGFGLEVDQDILERHRTFEVF